MGTLRSMLSDPLRFGTNAIEHVFGQVLDETERLRKLEDLLVAEVRIREKAEICRACANEVESWMCCAHADQLADARRDLLATQTWPARIAKEDGR